MASLGVALIGTGFMGKCHAMAWSHVRPVFGDLPDIRLETLCDVDPELTLRRSRDYGFARAETDWRKLIEDDRIDVVSITAPNNVHREMAVAFLEAGKHVWCEKPMALTLDEAEAMAAAARKARGRTLLGYNYIKNPAVLHARHLVTAGAIGDVVHFRGQVDEDYLASPDVPWSKRARIDLWGLGTLGDITCHLVSFAHFLIGDIARVSADMETVVRQRPVPGTDEMREVENEDIAHAIVRFRSGISGTLLSSRAAWGRKSLIRFEIHGTRGMLTFDQERMNELQLYVNEGPEATRGFRTILTGPVHSPYGQFTPAPGHQLGFNELKVIEAKHFLDCIASGAECFVNFEEGLKIERVIHGMARSAREKTWVEVS
ncbi:Gfo/Idh/MocA family protein [Taklimakanibacter lacteus]|uniref:Gfo/Idh/MocA family protein n=1 Tax=Taklimakanibacter lacteus TaxID=2268456 RepID=UPI000E673262